MRVLLLVWPLWDHPLMQSSEGLGVVGVCGGGGERRDFLVTLFRARVCCVVFVCVCVWGGGGGGVSKSNCT